MLQCSCKTNFKFRDTIFSRMLLCSQKYIYKLEDYIWNYIHICSSIYWHRGIHDHITTSKHLENITSSTHSRCSTSGWFADHFEINLKELHQPKPSCQAFISHFRTCGMEMALGNFITRRYTWCMLALWARSFILMLLTELDQKKVSQNKVLIKFYQV